MWLRLKTYKFQILLAVILIVGAYLRLHMIRNYMTFLGDEGRDVLVVKRMIVDHKFTLLGPTASVGGFFLGPIYYYFMLPFLWVSRLDPVGPAIMVAFFGIATIFLVYKIGRDFYSIWAGLIAASLYAVSPIVIAYSRSSWNPNVVPFFSTLLIYMLWRLVARPRPLDGLWIGIILGIGIQLHYLFLFLFVVVASWYTIQRKSLHFRSTFGLTVLGFLVGVSPFLAFEVRHGFANTRSVIQFIFAGKETGYATITSYATTVSDVAFRLFGRLLFRLPSSEIWENLPLWYTATLTGLTRTSLYVSVAFILLALGGVVARAAAARRATILLGAWFFVCLALFGFYRKSIYDYYFGIFFAFPFIIVGGVAAQLLSHRWMRWVMVTLWGATLYFNWLGRPFVFAPNNQVEQVKRIAQTAFEKTDGKPFNFALVTGGNSDHAYRYFFEIWGRPPVTIENDEKDPERKTVTDQLIVICETLPCEPLGHSLWEIAGFGRAEIVGTWDVPFVKVYKLVHYTGV